MNYLLSLLPINLLKPFVLFLSVFGIIFIVSDSNLLDPHYLWLNTPALTSILKYSILIGLYMAFVLFLPEIVVGSLLKLGSKKYKSFILELKDLANHFYCILILVLLICYNNTSELKVYLVTFGLIFIAWGLSSLGMLKMKHFWWASLFFIPTTILIAILSSVS